MASVKAELLNSKMIEYGDSVAIRDPATLMNILKDVPGRLQRKK